MDRPWTPVNARPCCVILETDCLRPHVFIDFFFSTCVNPSVLVCPPGYWLVCLSDWLCPSVSPVVCCLQLREAIRLYAYQWGNSVGWCLVAGPPLRQLSGRRCGDEDADGNPSPASDLMSLSFDYANEFVSGQTNEWGHWWPQRPPSYLTHSPVSWGGNAWWGAPLCSLYPACSSCFFMIESLLCGYCDSSFLKL